MLVLARAVTSPRELFFQQEGKQCARKALYLFVFKLRLQTLDGLLGLPSSAVAARAEQPKRSLGERCCGSHVALLGPTSKAFRSSLLLHLVGVLYHGKNLPSCSALAEKEKTRVSEDPWVPRGSAALPGLIRRTEEALTP